MMMATDSAATVREELLTLQVQGWAIPAALTLPRDSGADAPLASAILLVSGSLFADVNGDFPTWNAFPHVYCHLARQLSARGHAVYRFAKLGPGTGSVAVEPVLAPTVQNWNGRLVIARAALTDLMRVLSARGIAAPRVILAGHSEGSVVVSRIAAGEHPAGLEDDDPVPTVRGTVLLSGPSVGILDIMREQVGMFRAPEQVDKVRASLDQAIAHIRRHEPIPPELREAPGVQALSAMPPAALAYMADCDASDPALLASRIPHPVLIVQGGKDTSVRAHHAERLASARAGLPTETRCFPELSHMYKNVPPEVTGMAEFGYPGETDPRVASDIDRWVRGLG